MTAAAAAAATTTTKTTMPKDKKQRKVTMATRRCLLLTVLFLSICTGSTNALKQPRSKLSSTTTTTTMRVPTKSRSGILRTDQIHENDHGAALATKGGEQAKKASIAASVFNLVNNVAGAGILTLSAGMASGTGWIPAVIICTILGAIGSHTFCIIGKACELTGEADFKVGTVCAWCIALCVRVCVFMGML